MCAPLDYKFNLFIVIFSYRQTVPTAFVLDQLGLKMEGWLSFLQATSLESAIVYSDSPENTKINAKDTYAILSAV